MCKVISFIFNYFIWIQNRTIMKKLCKEGRLKGKSRCDLISVVTHIFFDNLDLE